MNRFLGLKSESAVPRRAYARIDSIEASSPRAEDDFIYLDSVDADWFDRRSETVRPVRSAISSDEMENLPIAVMGFWLSDLRATTAGNLSEGLVPGAWVEVVRDGPDAFTAQNFPSLFTDPTAISLSISRVAGELAARLDSAFSLANLGDASAAEMQNILGHARDIDFINVLDVGQGNACGLWSSDGGARLYVDLGGGVVGNAKTFPKQFRALCTSNAPPVVLTHWDWDHWSTALRISAARRLEWLAPRQKLGPVHLAFAYELDKYKKLFIWPSNLPSINVGDVFVEKCTGVDQNNSGLSVTVIRIETDGTVKRALLPGDADFSSIPSASVADLDGLVASHHGSNVGSIALAKARPNGGVLCYSYGHGNSFGHPRLHAQLGYLQAGWSPDTTLSTTQSTRKRPCNVAISMSGAKARTGCSFCTPAFYK